MKARLLSCLLLCGMMMSPGAALSQEAPSLKVGDPAPALTVGKWIKGEPVGKLEAGKIYVLEFWATWCGPCVKAIPHVTAMQKQFPEMVFIGVNVWERAPKKVAPFVQKMGDKMDYRVVTDDVPEESTDGTGGKMDAGWLKPAGVEGIPASMVVGKDGRILWMGDPTRLEPVLTAVAAGKPIKEDRGDEAAEAAAQKKFVEIIMVKDPEGTKTLAALEALGKKHPKLLPQIHHHSFLILRRMKDYDKAYAVAAQMLESCKDEPDILAPTAYTIMTPDEFNSSNAPLALQLAEQAVKATGGDDPRQLELLASAHFEVGRAKAIEVTRRAVDLATANLKLDDPDAKDELQYANEKLDAYTNIDPDEAGNGETKEKAQVPPAEAPTLKVGDPAPALTVDKWIKGEPVAKFEAGKIYVLEFWATWCAPCVEVIPHITAFQKQYPEMVFIGVNVCERDAGKAAPFVTKMGDKMDYRVMMEEVPAGSKETRGGTMYVDWLLPAGLNSIPQSMIVGKDGKILWMGHPAELEPVLKAVAQGKPIE